MGLEAGGSDAAIIEAVLAFAASMDLTVTGEGVESETQAAQLRAMGCNNGQGYLYSRPVPGEQARLLARSAFTRLAA
jgi:EAL domain-containing protein (putative c-di-GMP-specific phosphodiesterase class I)